MTYSAAEGFAAVLHSSANVKLDEHYRSLGYSVVSEPKSISISASTETFRSKPPLICHAYVQKMLGVIPNLALAEPLEQSYSEISLNYMLAYYLGMIARYYPTHWIALINGDTGDLFRSIVIRAQDAAEQTFPILTSELIEDAISLRNI